MRSLSVTLVSLRGFRNLGPVDLDLGPALNVFHGDNGQGKTNVIEALYLVATSKSFRTSRATEMIAHGHHTLAVRARIDEHGTVREQSIGISSTPRLSRDVRVDGKRCLKVAEYAVKTPVVVFHPGSVALSSGAGAERRRLLDRLALYRSPAALVDAAAYLRATRARQRVLETRGEAAPELDHWEELVVRHGTSLVAARRSASDELVPELRAAFSRIGPAGVSLDATYRPSAEAPAEFLAALRRDRPRDRARRSASVGPHRDDLELSLAPGGRMRGTASQGQHRAAVLALQLAEMTLVARARGAQPILLLDDVSSELDRDRTAALLAELGAIEGQVVVTTTRPELLDRVPGAASLPRFFSVDMGRISRA